MKTCKKLFSLLLVAVMLVAAIPFASFADEAAVPAAVEETVTLTTIYVMVNGTRVVKQPFSFDVKNPAGQNRYVFTDSQAEIAGLRALQAAGLEATYGTGYDYEETVYNYTDKAVSVALVTKTPAPAPTKEYTVQVRIGSTPETAVNGQKGKSTQPDTLATSEINNRTAAYAILAECFPGVYPESKYNFEAASVKGDTIYIRVSEIVTPPATPAETTYTTVTVNIDGKLYDSYSVNYKKAGELQNSDASAILAATGKSFDLTKYSVKSVVANGTAITVDLETIPYAGWTLKVTDGSTTKTYTKDSYTGSLTNVSEIMTAFGATNDFTIANYETASVANAGKNFTVTLVTKPTANDIYTVNVAINGNQYASKSNVTYRGTFGSNATDAQAILSAARIDGVTASNYEKITVTKSSNNVISIDLRNVVTIKVYNNASTFTNTEMEIGRPYVNYLGTNIINNSTFGGITVKDNSGASRFYTASQVNGGTAVVNANDVEVTIQRNGDSCTLYFLRSDGTVLESRKLYAGDQIGTLPSYIVGNVPAVWTYNGKPISATDVYNFKTTSVNIVPYFGGISDVYVDVYTNGNVKTMQTRVKVTDLVQNGVLYLNSEVKSSIASALRNSSNKNLTYTAFFDASSWSDFIKTKNTNGAAEPIRVGDNSERQGAVYLYVMVNNVTQKATDSTNPKTGDDVKLGVAAAVLAVAVVGFGAAIVIKKKKGVQ